MTIPQRILVQVAAAAGLVIAVATGVTYGIVYDAAKKRDLRNLETYVSERSRREEIGFLQAQANLMLVRGQFLKRMEMPVPRDYQAKWDRRFRLFRKRAVPILRTWVAPMCTSPCRLVLLRRSMAPRAGTSKCCHSRGSPRFGTIRSYRASRGQIR